MSRTTYNMSKAQMKRITEAVLSTESDRSIGVRLAWIEKAMRDEDVSMTYKASQIRDLLRYWAEDNPQPWLATAVAEEALREYYDLRGHVDTLHGALRGMGIVPWEDNA